jgi:glycosyltransferase involved in cell wall biosynthesis
MLKKKLYIIQQYLSWNGHHMHYFLNLVSNKYDYLYCATEKIDIPNSVFLPAKYKVSRNEDFLNFIRGRFFDSFQTYKKLFQDNPDLAHLIEFEPFSFLYFLVTKSAKIPHLIITIHAVKRITFASPLKNTIAIFQRKIYRYTLRRAAQLGSDFVTHYQHHRKQLLDIIGDEFAHRVKVINYPCPAPKSQALSIKKQIGNRMLIYGQIREDKGIYEFLTQKGTEGIHITIAGRILDQRILSVNRPGLTIINKFIEEFELQSLLADHDFMLLPYTEKYSGGAGTLKDSLSYGLPVIVSDLPIFREVIQEAGVGFIYKNISEISELCQVRMEQYQRLVSNCTAYATKFDWNYMRREYFNLYEESLNSVH